MQKRASQTGIRRYDTVFAPLPAEADAPLYYDKAPVCLPYAEEIPFLHYHNRYEIGVCEGGDGLFLSEGVFASVTAGDFVFVAPGRRHYSRSLNEEVPCQCRFLYLRADRVQTALGIAEEQERTDALSAAGRVPVVIRKGESPKAAALLREMMESCLGEGPCRETSVSLRLAVFLLEAGRWFPGNENVRIPPSREPAGAAAQIAEHLSLHYKEQQTAGELAAMCHLSESQLRRQFTAAYGMPPVMYRNFLRCRIGSELLIRTQLSVADISDQLGYSAPSDFYRMFLRFYGVSPSEYRKSSGGKSC